MNWFKTAIVASLSAVLPAVAMADPFDSKQIPADSKWLLHVDVDAARGSKIWDMLNDKLSQNPDYTAKVQEVEQISAMRFPEDVHDVTFFGNTSGDDAGVVIIHGKMDRDKTISSLQAIPSFASQSYGNYQVLNWDDNGKKIYGAFHDGDLTVIGRSAAVVENALDTVDGKVASLKPDSAMAGGAAAGKALVYAAARDLASLKKENQPQSPMVQQIDTAWISLSESENNAVLQANVLALTPETASQMKSTLQGVQAMVNLAANGDNADTHAKNIAAALSTLDVTMQDRTLRLQWPISLDSIKNIMDKK
jgi:hypothetical protein